MATPKEKKKAGGARAGAGQKKTPVVTEEISQSASSEPVGVTPDPPVPPVEEPEEQLYFCINCKQGGISKGTPNCPTCEIEMDWDGVAA